ncbi:hypothetical protein RHMOL_Rhmol01G0017000 [Rhododendron molle]|uniref:Uncharacterized protein n=1 Tax=Rhododendron molle TaxID=49168 RepID=A0ACC0PYW3_RHOML|nr:hypothetical protein RHMOL_Rhmol01G0017000 [Rhododendron molle]
MNIYFFVQNRQHSEELDVPIKNLLCEFGAKRKRQILLEFTRSPRQKKLMQTLMVVASLFAAIAFQVGVNPPSSVWQEDIEKHQAGIAILAYKYSISYSCFMYFNTVGFLLCLALILWLLMATGQRPRRALGWILPVMSLWAIMTTAFTYTYFITVVSPKQTMAVRPVTKTILVSVIVWAFLMLTFAVAIVSAYERARPKKAMGSTLNYSISTATNSLTSTVGSPQHNAVPTLDMTEFV